MTKLNQVIAIEKGVKSRAHDIISEVYKTLQKPELFNGIVRTYRKKDDEGEDLPSEKKHIQFRVRDVLGAVRMTQSELFEVTAQKDLANATAKAPVVVNGQTILPELPVTTLLFLEKQITDMRALIAAIPVLDSSENWTLDANSGVFKTDPPVETHRTKKVARPIVLYDATDKHPAQTQLIQEDIIAGFWSTVRLSAAMPKPEKERIAERMEKLLIGIKQAREQANDADASKKPAIGFAIFEYLFAE